MISSISMPQSFHFIQQYATKLFLNYQYTTQPYSRFDLWNVCIIFISSVKQYLLFQGAEQKCTDNELYTCFSLRKTLRVGWFLLFVQRFHIQDWDWQWDWISTRFPYFPVITNQSIHQEKRWSSISLSMPYNLWSQPADLSESWDGEVLNLHSHSGFWALFDPIHDGYPEQGWRCESCCYC